MQQLSMEQNSSEVELIRVITTREKLEKGEFIVQSVLPDIETVLMLLNAIGDLLIKHRMKEVDKGDKRV